MVQPLLYLQVCDTCPGALLLIDVDHYAHWDHGQCVDKCPEGLVADCEYIYGHESHLKNSFISRFFDQEKLSR